MRSSRALPALITPATTYLSDHKSVCAPGRAFCAAAAGREREGKLGAEEVPSTMNRWELLALAERGVWPWVSRHFFQPPACDFRFASVYFFVYFYLFISTCVFLPLIRRRVPCASSFRSFLMPPPFFSRFPWRGSIRFDPRFLAFSSVPRLLLN
jgi:hypothetical protein